jgi:RNA polymerase sigma factor (sigma-70 family)
LKEARNITTMPGIDPSPEPAGTARLDIRTLFEQEEGPLLRYAFSLVGRRAVAEELVQEAFLQLHTHWDTVTNCKAWLYRSVRNRAYNHHRDNRREILTDKTPPELCENAGQTPENLLQRMEATGFLRLLLAELEPADRQLVELKYYENLKYTEISQKSGLSVSNVGYRLHHILKQLAGKLREHGIDGTNLQPSTSTI